MDSSQSLIRIMTVDDHPLLRKGIAALVNSEPDLKLVAEAANGKWSKQKNLRGNLPGGFNRSLDYDDSFRDRRNRADFRAGMPGRGRTGRLPLA